MSVESIKVVMPEDEEMTVTIEIESGDDSPSDVTTLVIRTKGKET